MRSCAKRFCGADIRGGKDRFDLTVYAVKDLRTGEVQDILLPEGARLSSGQLESPVRMSPEHLRVLADHLRLHPQTELQAHGIDLVHKSLQSAIQLSLIHKPVTQGRGVVIPVPEPAVIHDQHVNPGFLRGSRKPDQNIGVKVHHRCFPVVDKNRSVLCQPTALDEMIPVQIMIRAGHFPKTFPGIHQCGFRRLKRFSR